MKNKRSIIPKNREYYLYSVGESQYNTYAEVVAKTPEEAIEIAADLLNGHYSEEGYNERERGEDAETYIRRVCHLRENEPTISFRYTVGRVNYHE